jgi:hypothetical protein
MLVKRFQGRVVKRMRRAPDGIRLNFLSKLPGQRGEQLTVTQSQWDQYGTVAYEPGISLAHLRESKSAQ